MGNQSYGSRSQKNEKENTENSEIDCIELFYSDKTFKVNRLVE